MKRINFPIDYLIKVATLDFTTYHYKTLLLLATKPMTQSQVAEQLGIKKQNINRYVSDLIKLGLVAVDRIEGRNKFLITVTKTVPITSQTDNPELFDNFTALALRLYLTLPTVSKRRKRSVSPHIRAFSLTSISDPTNRIKTP